MTDFCACGYGPGRHRVLEGNCPGVGAQVVARRRARDLWMLGYWITFPDGAMIGPYRRYVAAALIAGLVPEAAA